MRLICATALSLSLGLLVVLAQDKPADPTADRASKLSTLKKKYETEQKELIEQFKKAQTPAEQRGIQAEMRELAIIYAGKVLAIAEENPKDDIGFDASVFIVKSASEVGVSGPDIEKAVGLITEHHAASPKVKEVLLPAMWVRNAGTKLLTAVSEKNPDKDTKGTAFFLRGVLIAQSVDGEEDETKVTALVKSAIDLFEQAKKVAPDAKLGEGTIGKFADTEIEGMKIVLQLFVGKVAPDIESILIDGKKAKLSDYRGKVVLLDFWATWCGPCVRMIPHERALMKKMAGKPFTIISVSVDEKKETLEKFIAKEPMPWVHWWDKGEQNPVLTKYRVQSFPTLYLIDHTGVIRYKWLEAPEDTDLDKAVESLVKYAEKK
ncbi:MAG: TlpA family protein disulfide reductase [Planctomycetia bacterium]|nr:TlpA family protein disulfide reductase [Planctomycetia bacterium]